MSIKIGKTEAKQVVNKFVEFIHNTLGHDQFIEIFGSYKGEGLWDVYVRHGMDIVLLWSHLDTSQQDKLIDSIF